MKKISSLLFLLTFATLSLFTSNKALAKSADCYVGSQKIGSMLVQNYPEGGLFPGLVTNDSFVSGDHGHLGFYVDAGMSKVSEVNYKVGNSGWTQTMTSAGYYEGDFTIDTASCGNVWTNVSYRSVLDGQIHYCNLAMPKYTRGTEVNPLLTSGCIFSNCPANGGSNVRAVQLDQIITYPNTTGCTSDSYRFYLNGQVINRHPYSYSGGCYMDYSTGGSPLLTTQGTQTLKVSPELPAGYSITRSYLTYYNFINSNYCGTSISGSTPTPTAGVVPLSCSVIQQTGFSGGGTPLINDYNTTQYNGSPQYTVFTANKTGKVTKAEIYSTLDRYVAKGNKVLQCKITNSTGSVNLGESSTNNGPFSKGTSWKGVPFTTPVNVTNGTSYRLYCKVNNLAGGGYVYWLDYANNRTTKTFRLSTCN